MAKLQGSFIWYELMTTDPVGAKAFYDAVVGWDIDAQSASPDMDYRMINRADGGMTGGVFTLNDEMLGHGTKPCWLGYIGVDDCDAAAKAIEAAGGKVVMPPMDIPMAGRIAMVSDCCGAGYYIMAPSPPPGGGESTAFSLDGLDACGWNELYAGNQDNALAFYTSLYGWTLPEPMDMGPMGKYQFIDHDGVTVGAIMGKPPHMQVPGWNHYFRVASIDTAKAAVEAGDGTVTNGPMEVPGGDWVINGVDPQGAAFALVGAK
jgi:predicted enzyme related to lactoylglutathione lyase